jgi:hypothetical protein
MVYVPVAALAALFVLVALLLIARRAPPVPRHVHDPNKKRIVVLGGGFAGVYTCAALEKLQRDVSVRRSPHRLRLGSAS